MCMSNWHIFFISTKGYLTETFRKVTCICDPRLGMIEYLIANTEPWCALSNIWQVCCSSPFAKATLHNAIVCLDMQSQRRNSFALILLLRNRTAVPILLCTNFSRIYDKCWNDCLVFCKSVDATHTSLDVAGDWILEINDLMKQSQCECWSDG